MIGYTDDEFTKIIDQVLKSIRPDDFGIFSFLGMPGTGRTVVAKTLFEDLYKHQEQCFNCGAWVTIGQKYQFKEILVSILAQINDPAGNDHKLLTSDGDEKNIGEYVCTSLEGRRYIIVLDDIWDIQVWAYLSSSFPKQDNGSLVLLTTGLEEVALLADRFNIYPIPVLNEDQSWDVLCRGLFGLQSCPPELEDAGKKIALNCQGLPIPLARVMLLLSKAEKTPEYWNELAADKVNSNFMVADDESEMLQLLNSFQNDDQTSTAIGVASSMLDFSCLIRNIKKHMFPNRLFPKMELMSFFGMAGIGKTNLVREIFQHQSVLHHFDHRVWITLGPEYQFKEILVDILAQICPHIDKMCVKENMMLAISLLCKLSHKRCLIVLDDVWDINTLGYLKMIIPNIKGKLLVTTRLAEVAEFEPSNRVHKMRLLDEEESWCLLCQKVFAKESCTLELEKAGKEIAKNCEGLPLMICTVADLLSKEEKTPEYWTKVAMKKNSSIFAAAYHQLLKVLYPSYRNLPQHLKACFLYMGVFPQSFEISRSKLMQLWIADGFLEPSRSRVVEDFAAKCLSELVGRTLIMVIQNDSNLGIKTCRLHSVFWHLSNSEAEKNKFFYAFDTCADNLIEDTKSQCRLCIRNSILFAIKDVHNSVASVSNAHSLLCTGPPHQYPVPICLGLSLLRVLDALTIRFYEFPIEVVELIHLRYLALTCNYGKIPSSISNLQNVQFLVVSRHLSIESNGDSAYLPMEIWDMKELIHLKITGSNLPNPKDGVVLPNLLTLLDVSARSCSKKVLKGIPNLKKLGIRIELAAHDNGNPFLCLNHISCLHKLESLKCVVVNPELRSEVFAPPAPCSMFPSGLKKLSLSGLGYPWKYMSIIGKLKNLEVFKLRSYAFQGPEWELDFGDFLEVKLLLIEDTDLVRWKHKLPSFSVLERLSIKHCYKLAELPPYLSRRLEIIEVVDCNPLTVTWAKQLKEKHMKDPLGSETLNLQVHSSWDAHSLKQ